MNKNLDFPLCSLCEELRCQFCLYTSQSLEINNKKIQFCTLSLEHQVRLCVSSIKQTVPTGCFQRLQLSLPSRNAHMAGYLDMVVTFYAISLFFCSYLTSRCPHGSIVLCKPSLFTKGRWKKINNISLSR